MAVVVKRSRHDGHEDHEATPEASRRHGAGHRQRAHLGAQYALIALGLTLIFALMNVLNFAHGQMYVLGGFVTYEVYGLISCRSWSR